MTVVLTPANQSVSVTPADLIRAALLELGVYAPEDKLSPQDGAWGLEKLQREIDQFNARQEMIFSHSFLQFNLQANHAPHTFGPGGDFNVPVRPVKIVSASFILNSASATPVDSPFINIRDADWWAANPLKSLANSIVTDLYYDPASPLGNCNFWPVCNIANPVRLEIWNSLTNAISLQAALAFPQGYWEAVVTDLAVRLAPSYTRAVSADLKESWNRAMRTIQTNNQGPPQIETNGGMPHSRPGARPDFNFLTGLRE